MKKDEGGFMDEREVERLVENEAEWRRFLIKKVDRIQYEQIKLKEEMSGLKVWIWVGRITFVSIWGGLIAWVQLKLK